MSEQRSNEQRLTQEQFDTIKQSPRQATVSDVEDLCDEIEALRKELDGYRRWERSVNEALNSGDGSYRP